LYSFQPNKIGDGKVKVKVNNNWQTFYIGCKNMLPGSRAAAYEVPESPSQELRRSESDELFSKSQRFMQKDNDK